MSHEKRPDPFVQYVAGCLIFLIMFFTVCALTVWLTPAPY